MDGDSIVTPTDSTPVSDEQPVVTDDIGEVDDQGNPIVPQSNKTPAPSQTEIDPLAELEKLTSLDVKVRDALKAGFLRQKDYTQKTQEIAETKKAAEAYQRWTPIISFLEKHPEVAKAMFATSEPNKPVDQKEEDFEIPDDPKEFFKLAVARAKAEALAELRGETEQSKKQEAEQAEINAQIAESEKLDPRLTNDETFAKQIAGWMEINYGDAIRSKEISIPEATKLAIEAHQKYEESLRQKVVTDLNDKAKKKTMMIPQGNGSPLPTAPKGGRVTMREAAAKAEEEIGSR